MRHYKTFVLLLLCLLIYNISNAQGLDKIVTMRFEEKNLGFILDDLQKNHGLNFSYSNNQIPLERKFSLTVSNVTLRSVLEDLCRKAELNYQIVGKSLVLTKAKIQKKIKNSAGLNIKGEPIEMREVEILNASIKPTLVLPTEDRIQLKKEFLIEKKKLLEVYDLKADSLKQNQAQLTVAELKIKLKMLMKDFRKDLKALKQNIGEKKIFEAKPKEAIETENVDTTILQRDWQVSFLTPIGTNGLESGKYTNKVSFNVLSGYAGGLRGAEFGSLANIERGKVKGAQFAGIANIVNDDMKGAQFAGITNVVNGYSKGGQFSGIANITADSSDAIHAAGITNVVGGNVFGAQLAGIANVAKGNMIGPQGAGIVNAVKGSMYGVQVAGIANVASKDIRGTQIAGIANISAKTVSGLQVAGIINLAKKVRGSQIGLINYADSVSGVQIGLISIAKNGYRKFEVFGGEALYGNVAFKMGMPHFYNIFAAGAGAISNGFSWGVGYGFGSDFKLSKVTNLNIDLLCYQLNEGEFITRELNLLNQAKINFSFLISNKTRLFVGPVFNIKVSNVTNDENSNVGAEMVPWNLYDKTVSGTNVMIWPGLHAGFRF